MSLPQQNDATAPLVSFATPQGGNVTNIGALLLEDGTVIRGCGIGATGIVGAELCFNTGMTGYQEILTDPSYAKQIIVFSFPHIGIVGTNDEDDECQPDQPKACGAVFRAKPSIPSNFRMQRSLEKWLSDNMVVGLYGIDTRAVVGRIRRSGMQRAVVANFGDSAIDVDDMKAVMSRIPPMSGNNLALSAVTNHSSWKPNSQRWSIAANRKPSSASVTHNTRITVIDFGTKTNIVRCLLERGCTVQTIAGSATFDEIMATKPDGVVLSNGPGDPDALGDSVISTVRRIVDSGLPLLGICLGHQILALSMGGKTKKMLQGHHGVNHPVLEKTTGTVSINSMNHGFEVDPSTLPDEVEVTHYSLFDGSNAGLRIKNRPVWSVQFHPEASPGPTEGQRAFDDFLSSISTS